MNLKSRSARSPLRWAVAVLAATTAALVSAAPADAKPEYPVNYDFVSAFATGTFAANTPPPGANIRTCRSSKHPRPVVLVHGFMANQNNSWQAVAPVLANDGYCVFSLTMGQIPDGGPFGNLESMTNSSKQLSAFVDRVRSWTGSDKVDLIGHSAGGTVQSMYLKYQGGAKYVHKAISVGGVVSGFPQVSGLATVEIPGLREPLTKACPGCGDLADPSLYIPLRKTMPSVEYVAIASRYDEFVTPYKNALLPAAPNVTNVVVQDVCPNSVVGHIGLVYDRGVIQIVLNHLDPQNRRPVPCQPGIPV